MPIRFLKNICQSTMLVVVISFCSASVSAQNITHSSGEDTILIEKEMTRKASFHSAFKSLARNLFDLDVDSLVSGGNNCRTAVIRSFRDFKDRTKYRVKFHQDEVEFKFTLNF